MTRISIKANDTAIVFSDTLLLAGAAYNLTGCSVLFALRPFVQSTRFSGSGFSAAATIVDAAAGTVSYSPTAGFPTAPGNYKQEWEVTRSDGAKLTFPSDGYNEIEMLEDLNA